MAMEDAISPVEELWRGSSLSLSGAENLAPVTLSGQNSAVVILMLAVAALSIVFFRQIALSTAGAFVAMFSKNRRELIFNDVSYGQMTSMTMVMMIPVYAFVLCCCAPVSRSYWIILAALSALLLYRRIMFALVAWINSAEGIDMIRKFSRATFIMTVTLSLPACMAACLFPGAEPGIWTIYLAVAAGLSLLPYLAIAFKRVFSIKFSPFFCFLYLCVLEILPIAAVVKFIVS